MTKKKSFSSEFRRLRESKGVSLRELARHLGYSPTFVSDVELGRRGPFEDSMIVKACRFLEIDYEDLVRLAIADRVRGAIGSQFYFLRDDTVERMVRMVLEEMPSE